MPKFHSLALATVLILAAAPGFGQDAQDHAAHHPGDATPSTQSAPAAGQAMMGGMMSMMGRGMGMGMMGGMAGGPRAEGRLAFIKAELKIVDAQAPQWNAFAEAVRGNATAMVGMRRAMMAQRAAATLPERLALADKEATAHLAAMKKTSDALGKLYAALTDEQKKIADGIVLGPMGMPMGMM